jgi:nucleoside-diphosphate-sugar epimerase
MNKKVLVTGGAGYIGSVLVRILLNKGYSVRVIDKLSFGGESLLEILFNPHFEFIQGDLRDEKTLDSALRDIDFVCHLAAIVGDPACSKFSDDANSINWDSSVRLFEKCIEYKIKKFVFASTCSNYGKMKDSSAYVNEESELNPVSLYAELKVKFENYLLKEQTNAPLNKTVLRFSTVYGNSPRTRFDLTVNEFTRDAVVKKELKIFGEQFWRPYCHVYDLASSVALVLESDDKKVNNNVYNVGDTKENYTKKMLVGEILKQVTGVNVEYVQKNEDPRDYRVNFEKIQKELGFKITKTVPMGVGEIHKLVGSGLISDPYSKKYSNI